MTWRIEVGDCRDVLRSLEVGSVHTVVTSPPYFGLRDYGTSGQIGLEASPDEFVAALVAVFREVRRVLRDDGTVWLNLGDSYSGSGPSGASYQSETTKRRAEGDGTDGAFRISKTLAARGLTYAEKKPIPAAGTKPKDLIGVPWLVAFALRADGWYLRSDIIWSKPNPMPESVTDRPTKAHEYLFLLSKSATYHYDADAIREPHAFPDDTSRARGAERGERNGHLKGTGRGFDYGERVLNPAGRNKRSVWTVATQPYAGAHFATFPPRLIEPCILAGAPERACGECGAPWVRLVDRSTEYNGKATSGYGALAHRHLQGAQGRGPKKNFGAPETVTVGFESSCSHGDGSASGVVLDPFAGAGTTGLVALQHGREFVGIELNPEYAAMARERIATAVRLGFRSPQNDPQPIPGQVSIFDLNGTA